LSTTQNSRPQEVAAIRWSARVSGLLLGGPFLFLFIAETWQSPSQRALLQQNAGYAALLILLLLYGVGMFVALKWERIGSRLSLGALAGFFLISVGHTILAHGLLAPFTAKGVHHPLFMVFWIPVILYLVCRYVEARTPRPT